MGVVGWNCAGKTAIVQRINGRSSEPLPTTGVLRDVCTLRVGPQIQEQVECEVELIDVGTRADIEMKKAAYASWLVLADAVIIVIDATSTCVRFRAEEVARAKQLMEHFANESVMRKKPFLVLANKCDRADALSVPEIMETFQLKKSSRAAFGNYSGPVPSM